MALLPSNPRDQKLLIVAILAVGLAAVYQQFVWTPKNDELNILTARLDTLDSLNKLTRMEVAKGNAAKMKQEANAYARELAVLRELVPTATQVPPLIDSISGAARRVGLELSAIQPDGVVNGDQFDTYRYKLGVKGPYHTIAEFLTRIASLSRIVVPINLSLLPATATGEVKVKKGEQLLDAQFQIQTYVAHTNAPAAPPPPAAGKPGAP